MTTTKGQEFAKTARRISSISPRTPRWRNGEDLFARVLENVEHAAYQPGWFSTETESALHPAIASVNAYRKHVQGYRINGATISMIQSMTPYQFTNLIARMVDAGITNNGEGERFFRSIA